MTDDVHLPGSPADASASEGAAVTPSTPVPALEALRAVSTVHYSQHQVLGARDVLSRIYALQRAVRFYPFEHPAVRDSAQELGWAVSRFHEDGVELQLIFFRGEILLGDQFLAEESMIFERLTAEMAALGIGSFTVSPGVTTEELQRAGRVLGAEPEQVARAGGIVHLSEEEELPHVRFGVVMEAEYGAAGTSGEERAFLAFANAVDLVEEMDDSLERGQGVDPVQVRGAVRSLVDGILSNRYSILQLTALKSFDEYTFYHSANVAVLSIALGSAILEDEQFLSLLGTAALLHDIGKLGVGLDVVNKTGQLTPQEWEAMRNHPAAGAQMVALMAGIDKAAIVPILEHHMRWDGKGYPVRAAVRRQALASRIIAIADTYDAMTSRRAYSAARTQDEAMSLVVRGAGSAFDPELVRVFVHLMGVFPPQSFVRLTSGEVGLVLEPDPVDPLRPVIRLISTPDGMLIAPVDIALAGRQDLSIESSLDPRLLNVAVEDYL